MLLFIYVLLCRLLELQADNLSKLAQKPTMSDKEWLTSRRWVKDGDTSVLRGILNSTLTSSGSASLQRLSQMTLLPHSSTLKRTMSAELVKWPPNENVGVSSFHKFIGQLAKLSQKNADPYISFAVTSQCDEQTGFRKAVLSLALQCDETDLATPKVPLLNLSFQVV
jgi:hypothetical protein